MRVMCIIKDGWVQDRILKKTTSILWGLFSTTTDHIGKVQSSGPQYGDECTVVNTEKRRTGLYYSLREWPEDTYGIYQALWFVPLLDVEEEAVEEVKIKMQVPDGKYHSN